MYAAAIIIYKPIHKFKILQRNIRPNNVEVPAGMIAIDYSTSRRPT